jgi:hypothetical protein
MENWRRVLDASASHQYPSFNAVHSDLRSIASLHIRNTTTFGKKLFICG